ncbi:ead/Ea22-like family protein [Escherichia coli]|nr:ead/Ea22-like family protein [Escherichia coli]EFE7919526.1 ead/Ea22-like family protein [Escherichia coli]
MSKIDYQALREAAQNAKDLGGIKNYKRGEQAVAEFESLITPHIVLALLDERERNQQYIKRRDQENEEIALTVGKLRVELEAAEKRIAELEAREVVLPRAHDVHPLGPQSAKIFCEFHRSIVNRCADEIRKVGVKVSIKGN